MRTDLFKRHRGKGSLGYLGYILVIIGGILMILLSLAGILSFAVPLPFGSPLGGYFGVGIISLILGVVAVVLSKRVSEPIWAIVLIVVGYLGGGIGGLLVLLGGVLGLLSRYV